MSDSRSTFLIVGASVAGGRAAESLRPEFRKAVETAAANIRAYAQRQMPREWMSQTAPGLRLG